MVDGARAGNGRTGGSRAKSSLCYESRSMADAAMAAERTIEGRGRKRRDAI